MGGISQRNIACRSEEELNEKYVVELREEEDEFNKPNNDEIKNKVEVKKRTSLQGKFL